LIVTNFHVVGDTRAVHVGHAGRRFRGGPGAWP
jgi:hypothetical protein